MYIFNNLPILLSVCVFFFKKKVNAFASRYMFRYTYIKFLFGREEKDVPLMVRIWLRCTGMAVSFFKPDNVQSGYDFVFTIPFLCNIC